MLQIDCSVPKIQMNEEPDIGSQKVHLGILELGFLNFMVY